MDWINAAIYDPIAEFSRMMYVNVAATAADYVWAGSAGRGIRDQRIVDGDAG